MNILLVVCFRPRPTTVQSSLRTAAVARPLGNLPATPHFNKLPCKGIIRYVWCPSLGAAQGVVLFSQRLLGVECESSSDSARQCLMAVAGVPIDVGSSASASRQAVRISRSIEDYPSAQNVLSSMGGLDKFEIGEDRWISRPPAADLKLVLEALSPGLDGWPLQRLNELAQELIACGNDEEPMVPVCQEMRGLLQNVFEALAHGFRPVMLLHRAFGNEEERSMVGVCMEMRGFLEQAFERVLGFLADKLIGCRNAEEIRVVVLGMRGPFRNAFEVLADELIASGEEEARSLVGVCRQMGGLSEDLFEALFQAFIPSGNQEDAMVDMCLQMRCLQVVLEALEGSSKLDAFFWGNISLEVALAMRRSGTVENVLWAFTWVETLLLEHDMLGVRSSEVSVMQSIRDRWQKVHFCMPSGLPQTKDAIDFHRRSALLACGQEREAVWDFEAPDSIFKGFEACYLCIQTSLMYHHGFRKPGKPSYGYGWSQLRDKFLWWIQRAATAGPQDHERWPLVRLHVLGAQLEDFTLGGRTELYEEVVANALAELQQIDLQLRFDFPVPLPDIQVLKLMGLTFSSEFRALGTERWQPQELLPENIGPEVLDRPEVQSYDQARCAYGCVVLRGVQLIEHHGQLEEGLEVFHTCLAKSRSSAVFRDLGFFETSIFGCCKSIATRSKGFDLDSANGVQAFVDRASRVQAFLVAHGDSLEPRSLLRLFSSNVRLFFLKCPPEAFTRVGQDKFQLHPRYKAPVEAFWKIYKDTCAALSQAGATQRRYEVRHMDTSSKLKAFAGSWIPSFYLYHVHVKATTVYYWSRFSPFPEVMPGPEIIHDALLCVETARNYRHEGFGPHINWNRIKRAHRACGPGAVFVHFAGLGWSPPEYWCSLDVWPDPSDTSNFSTTCTVIVVQDEGEASFLELDQSEQKNVQQIVWEISRACLDRRLESDSCTNALEMLYDLLIRPLLDDSLIHMGNKLIISAVGYCKDVPFSILRNKDSGRYLFEEVKLAFTPSFLMLDHCQSRYEILQERTLLAGAGAAVAVGDPRYLPYQHIPLPGSRKEVDAICQLFDFCQPQHEIVTLLGGDATVERVLEWVNKPLAGVASGTGQCSQAFIHIAAHGSGGKQTNTGTLSLASPATSRIRTRLARRAAQGNVARDEVAQSSDEEGDEEPQEESSKLHATLFGHQVLEASELDSAADGLDFLPRLLRSFRKSDAGTSLQCDDILLSGSEWSAYMVVLSACNTAVGVALNANVLDLLSFSRAFMTAGVPCSILAQWYVDDSAAAHLMPLFYEALSKGEDACSALQSAMIQMHHSGKYTLHQIAPFIVTGLPTVRLPPQMRR